MTKPQSEQPPGKFRYLEICEPNIEPFVYVKNDPWENTEHTIGWLRSGSVEPLQVVMANDLLTHGLQFKEYSRQAVKLAEEMKAEREAMRDQSFDIWLSLLAKPQTNDPDEKEAS